MDYFPFQDHWSCRTEIINVNPTKLKYNNEKWFLYRNNDEFYKINLLVQN